MTPTDDDKAPASEAETTAGELTEQELDQAAGGATTGTALSRVSSAFKKRGVNKVPSRTPTDPD